MTDIEPRPIKRSLESPQHRDLSSSDLIRAVAADLTPYQAVRVGKKMARQRMRTAVELARIEDETLLGEAGLIARAKVRATEERAERLLHAERMDRVAEAALKHEEASRLVDLVQDEAAHGIFRDGLKAVSTRYVGGVTRRAGS
jgi:hypothetical protein